jgi:transcriptional regulator with XRE-family HTH domain
VHRIFREVREGAGTTKSNAAREMGVSYELLRRIEQGDSVPSIRVIKGMADAYQLDEVQHERLLLAAFRIRSGMSRNQEHDELRKAVQDRKLLGLASAITGEVVEAVATYDRKVTNQELHSEVRDAVEFYLGKWEFR